MTQDTKGQGGSDITQTADNEGAGPQVAGDPRQPGGSDYAGLSRALTEIQEGRKLPQFLIDRGYESVDDVPPAERLAELESRTASKPGGETPSETDGFVIARDPKTERPRRPLPSDEQCIDPVTGEFDEARHAALIERYEDLRDEFKATGAAVKDEARYLTETAKSDDAKPVVAALAQAGISMDGSEDVIGVFANIISGGNPASQEHVRNGLTTLKAAFDAYADARFAESTAKEKANAETEPDDAGAAGGGRPPQRTGTESDKPQTIEQMAAEGVKEFRAEQAAR